MPVLNQSRLRPRLLAALSSAARFCFSHASPNGDEVVCRWRRRRAAAALMIPELKTPTYANFSRCGMAMFSV